MEKIAPTRFNFEVFATSKCQLKKYCLYHFQRKARLVWDTNSLLVKCYFYKHTCGSLMQLVLSSCSCQVFTRSCTEYLHFKSTLQDFLSLAKQAYNRGLFSGVGGGGRSKGYFSSPTHPPASLEYEMYKRTERDNLLLLAPPNSKSNQGLCTASGFLENRSRLFLDFFVICFRN